MLHFDFIVAFIHVVNKYLLCIYYMFSIKHVAGNQRNWVGMCVRFTSSEERQTINRFEPFVSDSDMC